MNNQPGDLKDIKGVSDLESVLQNNFETVASRIYRRRPSLVAGVVTTTIGPPTSGAHVIDEVFVDANLAVYRCTSPGTPGTFIQDLPGVGNPPSGISGTKPTGYAVQDQTNSLKLMKWNGSAWVAV